MTKNQVLLFTSFETGVYKIESTVSISDAQLGDKRFLSFKIDFVTLGVLVWY